MPDAVEYRILSAKICLGVSRKRKRTYVIRNHGVAFLKEM